MTCWSYFPVIFLNTFPLSKDAKLSSVCAVPVDDWFPLAKDAGTKVPQCAWPNLEGGATVEKTASVKSERFHHTYTAVPLLSHLPQHTWVVTEKSFEADYENTSFLFFFSLSFCTLFFVRVSQSKRWNEKTMGERARERLLCTFSSRPHPPPPSHHGFLVWPMFSFRALCLLLYEPQTKNIPTKPPGTRVPFLVALQVIHHPSHHTWMGLCSQSAHPHLSHEEV